VPNGDVDWTTKAGVTPVKNQGACGSCWAFSATGVMESWALVNKKGTFDLSEQQLMDCSGSFGNQGCNGGLPYLALQYVKVGGITIESSYPYTARQGKCQKNGGSFTIPGIQQVKGCTALATGIATRPISVTVDATNWSGYRTGIFNNCATNINHAVLLVGVISNNWKIKNSWGAGWGEKGFIRLSPGNTCAVCAYSSPFIQ
jgi:cathepsin L